MLEINYGMLSLMFHSRLLAASFDLLDLSFSRLKLVVSIGIKTYSFRRCLVELSLVCLKVTKPAYQRL